MEILGTGRHRAIGIIGLSVFGILLLFFVVNWNTGDSITEAKERALQDDLWTMRSLIHDYTSEQHKRPESLDDLVAAGYMKRLPKDPFTDRRDTWIVEWSSDSKTPGVVGIRSGASGASSKGTRYNDW